MLAALADQSSSTVTPLAAGEAARGGLILGNDVSDRATLLRLVDPAAPQSGRGFTDGKSAPGYLPVGDLFVVPRDLRSFVAGLTLELSVNGERRQRAPVTDWSWDLDQILDQARAQRERRWGWRLGEARLPLTPDGTLPARSLILAGTPAGTVFQGVSAADRWGGLMSWVLAGCRGTPVRGVVEHAIAEARAERAYLQPGDAVAIRVDCLGRLPNQII